MAGTTAGTAAPVLVARATPLEMADARDDALEPAASAALVIEAILLESEPAAEPDADARLEVAEAAALASEELTEAALEKMELMTVPASATSLLASTEAGRSWALASTPKAAIKRIEAFILIAVDLAWLNFCGW